MDMQPDNAQNDENLKPLGYYGMTLLNDAKTLLKYALTTLESGEISGRVDADTAAALRRDVAGAQRCVKLVYDRLAYQICMGEDDEDEEGEE